MPVSDAGIRFSPPAHLRGQAIERAGFLARYHAEQCPGEQSPHGGVARSVDSNSGLAWVNSKPCKRAKVKTGAKAGLFIHIVVRYVLATETSKEIIPRHGKVEKVTSVTGGWVTCGTMGSKGLGWPRICSITWRC